MGVPYFNWGPAYTELITSVQDGSFEQSWDWLAPDWSDINNLDTSAIGFIPGDALSEDNAAALGAFIEELATGGLGSDEGFNLWSGPIVLQDGTEYVAEGEVASLEQVWYLPQLLDGMTGDSVAAE